MAAYSYHHWEEEEDGRDGLIDFEQYYTFPPRPPNHVGGQGILHRLLKRQYRPVDVYDNCHHARKKKQQLGRQWGGRRSAF
ncbi:uncharacterized protein PG998_003746 [Apiospora kogelbergensis]|uniref:uncharacterized protein n=1 Tax=Apiospora kogelbergensis TaxID=1337665 RepID=UPI00312FFC57